jgi:hypothetical protein
LPSIEILIVAAGKDIELVNQVITYGVTNSINPIDKVALIVPEVDLMSCKKLISKNHYPCKIEILCEDEVLEKHLREKLKNRFNKRYGWVLQQVLSLKYVLQSSSNGILLLDADTMVLRKVGWLDSKGKQKLMVGCAYHRPYHELLSKLINSDINPNTTHVTHHMMIQPNLLREMFQKYKLKDVSNLIEELILLADKNLDSPLSVDYELYAQALLLLYPEKAELVKFSNVSIPRIEIDKNYSLLELSTKYNSVSLHSYLEASN